MMRTYFFFMDIEDVEEQGELGVARMLALPHRGTPGSHNVHNVHEVQQRHRSAHLHRGHRQQPTSSRISTSTEQVLRVRSAMLEERLGPRIGEHLQNLPQLLKVRRPHK
jgi:hypothetical protein